MKVKNELRKLQKAITDNFKYHAEKAEKILGAIENCEKTIAALSESLSAVLGVGVQTAPVAAKAKVAKVINAAKVAKPVKGKRVMKPNAGLSLKDHVRDFLAKAGKPMKIAEIVLAMQKAGHVFQAKRPVPAMSLLLYNNSKVFKKVKPGTFAVMAANVQKADVAEPAKVPQVKAGKIKVIKAAKIGKAKPVAVKPAAKKVEASTLKDSVREFMLKAGKPMKIAEIVKAMQKAGHVFESKKPVPAMSKLMYNHAKVFKRVKPGTFKAV